MPTICPQCFVLSALYKEVETQLEATQRERDELRAQLDVRTTERADMATTIFELRAQLDELSAASEALRAEYVVTRAERDTANNVIFELQERIE